jgi:predicted membrane protein
MEKEVRVGTGIGFGSLLGLLFIGLKLGNVINWSWIWVLSPFWIPAAVIVGVFITFVIAMAISE